MVDVTDKELKNLKPRAKLYKVTDRRSEARNGIAWSDYYNRPRPHSPSMAGHPTRSMLSSK